MLPRNESTTHWKGVPARSTVTDGEQFKAREKTYTSHSSAARAADTGSQGAVMFTA